MGSRYNVLNQWDDNSKTWEPLEIMIKDDPIPLASYTEENDLIDKVFFEGRETV